MGDINRGLWPNRNRGNRHLLFAYVYNNYWHTNYKASQGGDIRCAFSVKLSETPFDAADATRFGWARTLDMTPGSQKAVLGGQTANPEMLQSLLTLDDGPVLLGELLNLDGSGRMLARLYNPSSAPAQTSIKVQGTPITSMQKTDLFGENGTPLHLDEKINVPARGITTVALQVR